MKRSGFTHLLSFLGLTLLVLFNTGCVRNPVNNRFEFTLMSAQEEVRVGEEQDKAVQKLYGKVKDDKLQEYVSNIGASLVQVAHARPFTYHFTVVDSGDINAFALPGGYIYVTRGLLAHCNSEAELAGVLGHEIGHVTARHHSRQQVRAMGLQIGSLLSTVFLGEAGIYLQRYIDLLFSGIYQSFGRQGELEADQVGQAYAYAAGWDPRETTAFLQTLDRLETGRNRTVFHGFFASHPETYERIDESQKRGTTMVTDQSRVKQGRKDFLRMLEGLPFGNRPEHGELDENLYRNGVHGISVQFPRNWETLSSAGGVVSRKPDASYFIQLITAKPKNDDYLANVISREDHFIKLREMAGKFEEESHWSRNSEERRIINEIPTFVSTYNLQSGLGRFYTAKAHFFIARKNLFVLLAFTPAGQESLATFYFDKVFESVRLLTEQEMEPLKPRKLVIYEVRDSDTFESIAEKFFGTTDKARSIAALNGLHAHLNPTVGDLLKIVVRKSAEETGADGKEAEKSL
ncbi:MAG: M48 family metalloprotease [bacterium]|nr:M48 family metalloprotease [bacterium]